MNREERGVPLFAFRRSPQFYQRYNNDISSMIPSKPSKRYDIASPFPDNY